MPTKPPTFKPGYAPAMRRETASARGYGREWQKARTGFLAANPLCVLCQSRGEIVAASVVDHIIPHKGNDDLFWRASNWQALCERCHNRKTASQDGGFGRSLAPSAPNSQKCGKFAEMQKNAPKNEKTPKHGGGIGG